VSLVYLAAWGCSIGLVASLLSIREPRSRTRRLSMLALGASGALMGSSLIGAAGDLSVMEIDFLVVFGALVGSLFVLVAAHGYARLHPPRDREAPARKSSSLALARGEVEAASMRITQPPPL